MELETRAKELIESVEYPNIATVSEEGMPWNTPVYGVADEELQFYWSSWKEAQHSINIYKNPNVFLTLYDSTRKRGDNNRRCLYIKGVAQEVSDVDEIKKGIELLYPEEVSEIDPFEFTGEGLRRIYKSSSDEIWLNDKSERQVTPQTIKMRIEVDRKKLLELRTSV